MTRMLCAVASLVVMFASGAMAQSRLALVIGNQGYGDAVGALANPHNDINIVGGALASLGFKVTTVRDASRKQLYLSINAHVKAMRAAGPGAVGFLYYSGHGGADVERAKDFLIPVDATDTGADTIFIDSVPLSYIFDELSKKAPGTRNFIAFDACRNSLKSSEKSLMKGFIATSAPRGDDMLIAFATAAGQTATDVGTRGGPYANALASEIVRPLYHLDIFQNVREAVIKATGGNQKPWELNGMAERVCFHPSCPAVLPVVRSQEPSVDAAKEEAQRRTREIKEARARLPVVAWKMQTMLPATAMSADANESDPASAIAGTIEQESSGRLVVSVLGPGTIAPALQLPRAVSAGVLDAALIWPGALSRQNPAFEPLGGAALNSVAPASYVNWLRADGRKLLGELYRKSDLWLVSMPCGLAPAGGFFYTRPLEQVADMRGKKVRTSSPLTTKLAATLGAQPTPSIAAELYMALDRGILDATESFSVDQTMRLGFHEVASNYYEFDANAVRLLDLVVNAESWSKLDPLNKVIVQDICNRRLDDALPRIARRSFALAKVLEARGVKVRELPSLLKVSYGEASIKVLAGEAEKSTDFRTVIESYQLFRN